MGNGNPEILIKAKLDKIVSLKNIQRDLKNIETQLPKLNLSINVNNKNLKTQLSQIQTQVNELKLKPTPIDFGANIDISKLTKSSITIKEISDKVALLAQKMQILQAQAQNAGISLNQIKINNFTNALNNFKIPEASTYLKEIRNEYSLLNVEMSKALPQTALENLDKRIMNMGTGITIIGNKFRTLGNAVPKDLNLRLDNLQNDLTAIEKISDPQTKINAYNKLVQKVKELNNEYKVTAQTTRLNNRDKNLEVDKLKFLAKMQAWLKKNSKAAKMCSNEIKDISSQVDSADRATLTKLGKQFGFVQKKAEAAGKIGRNFIDEAKNDIKKFATFFGAGGLIVGGLRQIKSGIQNITDLDSALTTMNMTMNTTKSQLVDLGESVIQMSKDVGSSISDISNIAEVYTNLNESADSVMSKVRPTALLSTASKMTGTEAASALQTIKNQFELTDESAIHLTDSIEKLSANLKMNFTTGIQNIVAATQEAGSVAKEAGESYEQFAAQVSAIAEGTGESGDTVGAGMKQIFARITRANSGNATAEEISKADKAFQSVGVSIRDTNGQFRDISDSLTDLYGKWGDLTSVEKSYVAEQASGSRRKNLFLTLMNRYNEVLDLTTKAENANGFAEETNAKRMDSINAKTQQFNATVTQLWTTLINSSVIKTVVDSGTGLISVFTNLNKTLGTIPTLAGAATLALSAMGKNVGRNMPSYVKLVA